MNGEYPRNPTEAARLLWENDRFIDEVTAELRQLRLRLPHLIKAKRLAYARAFLTAQGAEHYRRQKAEEASAEEAFARDLCEQEIEACRERMWNLRGHSEDLRAINSNLKEELRALGSMP
jgi:hypothetical protein